MNYLAHAYFSVPGLYQMGNLLADFYHSTEIALLPSDFQAGIMAHRHIDSFTDQHPEIAKAKAIFSPLVGRYAGAFVDVSLDYFLANDPRHSEEFWKEFSQNTYQILEAYQMYWPQKFIDIYPNMLKNNWLYHYRFAWAMQFSFNNLFAKAKYLEKNEAVFDCFMANLEPLQKHYDIFIADLQQQDFLMINPQK